MTKSSDQGKLKSADANATVDGKRTQIACNLVSADSNGCDLAKTENGQGELSEAIPAAGEYLGSYRVDSELARGGMGVVLRCKDTRLKRDVAVKILSVQHENNAHLKRRFLHEARVMSQLQHPGIIPVFEIGNWTIKRPYFVMELISGETMDSLAQSTSMGNEKGRLIKAFEQLCQTLAFVHSNGIIHLDVKPANVMVGAHGQVYLMDWGLSKFVRPDLQSANLSAEIPSEQDLNKSTNDLKARYPSRRISGTPAYLAPEQARGEKLDARTDVFCLGGLLCEILTGQPTYLGESLRSLFVSAAKADLAKTFARLDACGEDAMLIRLARRCLSPEPDDRPEDAASVAGQVSSFLHSALRNAQSDLSRFFDLSLDLFCIASFDGYFLRVNSNFSRVLGYSSSELVSRSFMEFVHPEDCESTVKAMAALISGNPVIRFRNRYRDVRGDYILFEWTAKSNPAERIVFAVAREVPAE